MSIGYACLTIGVPGTRLRTCSLKNAAPDTLTSLIRHNLDALDYMLDYNIENGIRLFRISSDIIPFGSHPVNLLEWWNIFAPKLTSIGEKARANGLRLSMHPGQYTVLNSPDEDVVERAIEDLRYHCRFLDSLGMGPEHKLILHVGGIYGDKAAAVNRFIQRYRCMDYNIRSRLVIENDDRQYTVGDVLAISESESIPVVFDNLHHQINRDDSHTEIEWIAACAATWGSQDGAQKLHYSQQAEGKRVGSHSDTIDAETFMDFYRCLPSPVPDIMLEVKDKNLSALKCMTCIAFPEIVRLEKEWSRYKYLVLERSPEIYRKIRELLKDKPDYPALAFYRLIDEAMSVSPAYGNIINAAQHVWGYVNTSVNDKEKITFQRNLERVDRGGSSLALKQLLWKLAEVQQQEYLLRSLYFLELHS